MPDITEDIDERYFIPPQRDLRCDWCKSEVSTPFVETNEGHIFCSEECQKAAMEQLSRKVALLCVLLLVSFPLFFLPFAGPMLVGLIFLGFCALMAPSESRLPPPTEMIDRGEVALIECSYCSQMNLGNSLRCSHCGAPLGKPEERQLTRRWVTLRRRRITAPVQCPHCGAVYAYRQEVISAEQTVTCQNCAKAFVIPRHLIDSMTRARVVQPSTGSVITPIIPMTESKRLTCPHCMKRYLYQPHQMSETGMLSCQHCGRQFRDSTLQYIKS